MTRMYFTLLLLLVPFITGCLRSVTRNAEEDEHDSSLPSFVQQNNPAGCDCVPQEMYMALAELGSFPLANFPATRHTDDLREKLHREAIGHGGKLTVHTLDETLRTMEKAPVGPKPLSVLVHQNGHLYELLGTMDIDDSRLFQLVHGRSQVWLVTKEQIGRAGFKEVWHLQSKGRNIPFRVGDGELSIDKVYENFGELKPQQEVRGTFVLENTGRKTIILGKPQTSCSCTVPNIKENTKLEPGQKKDLEIIFQSGTATSARQTVVMKCYEEGTGISQTFSLELFANRRQSMEIAPTSLDFGLVVPNESVFRTVSLKEMPTDRFTILKIDVGQLPITYTKQDETTYEGLQLYRTEFNFVLKNAELKGNQSGVIEFTTDSKQFPHIKIPVAYKVAPAICAIPSIVSFGMINVGEKIESKVEFESRTGQPVEVTVTSLPKGITFEKNGNVCWVQFTPYQSGIWEDVIELDLQSGKETFHLALKCAAFVKEQPYFP